MKGNKKTIAYAVVSLIAIAGGYFIYKYFSDKAALKTGVPQPQPKGLAPDKTASGKSIPSPNIDSNFPLKNGSRNTYVKELQDALGVAIDGIFGKNTLAALQEQAGKTQIANYDELEQTIANIIATDNASAASDTKSARANSILNQFTSNQSNNLGLTDLYTLRATAMKGYLYDSPSGNYLSNGTFVNLDTDSTFNLNDYQPNFVTADGYLMINIPNGNLQGYWKLNPNDITIQ
jgi:hypothetical protein